MVTTKTTKWIAARAMRALQILRRRNVRSAPAAGSGITSDNPPRSCPFDRPSPSADPPPRNARGEARDRRAASPSRERRASAFRRTRRRFHGRAADVDLLEEEAGQLELLGGAAGRAVNDDAASRRHREDESVEVGAARAVDDHFRRAAGLVRQFLLPPFLFVGDRRDGSHRLRADELLRAAARHRDLRSERLCVVHGYGGDAAAASGQLLLVALIHLA